MDFIGLDVSKFKNLESLVVLSNENLLHIDGIKSIKNLQFCEIFDNPELKNVDVICRDIIGQIRPESQKEFNLDVLMYPQMQKEIENYNQNVNQGRINGETITQQMQDYNFLWSEMINRQPEYQTRIEKEEQKGTYRNYLMRTVDNEANKIIETYLDKTDTDEQKFAILYGYMTQNIMYDYAALTDEERMTFRKNKYNANGMAKGFLEGKCVCEGYSRMLMYLLKKCGIEAEEIACLTNRDKIDEGRNTFDHSIIKVKLNGFNYLSDVTWDATSKESQYKYFLLSKEEMTSKRKIKDDAWDITSIPISQEKKLMLQRFAEARIKERSNDEKSYNMGNKREQNVPIENVRAGNASINKSQEDLEQAYKSAKINQEDINRAYEVINRTKEEREQDNTKPKPSVPEER